MFEPEYYDALISKFHNKQMNFTIDWFGPKDKNTLLLRHDIDFSITQAIKIATQERNLGVFSTFFFMLTSNMYNLFSRENRQNVLDIKKMGHKISIHFDPTVYNNNLKEFEKEKLAFENAFSTEVDIVSIHRPGPFLQNNNIKLSGVYQTYHDNFFKNMEYISDSGGRDVASLLEKYFNNINRIGLQLLIHPIWWSGESKSSTETLNNWRANQLNFITKEIRSNCKTYGD